MSSRALRFSHDWHVFLQALLAGLPAVVVSMVFLLAGDFSFKIQWTVGVIVIICWLGCTAAARMRV
ncbi:MAG TPA: PAS domain-containing sensor histidine kinase, partial [Opitutaceae bacterium]